MGKLGVILLSLFAIILTLFAAGVFSIERMMDMISEKRADAPKEDGSKKTLLPKREQPKTRETAYAPRPDKKRTDVFEVSKKSARKPHSPITRIYDEPILDAYSVNTKAPVRLPNLTNDGREIERTPLGKQKGAFEVPTVSGAKDRYQTQAPSKKKPAAKKPSAKSSAASAPKKPVEIDKIDLMEAVRMESDEERNRKYVKSALSDHSKAPKPVLGYSVPDTFKKTKSQKQEPKYAPDDYAAPAYDTPAAPTKKSSSDSAVKPASEEKKAVSSKPEQNEALHASPAPKKAPMEPKPSFFEGSADVKKEAYVPKTKLAGMREEVPGDEYDFPPIDLMETSGYVAPAEGYDPLDMQRAELLVQTLQSFSIQVKIIGISHGPAVTRFELLPAPGIKVSKITQYADDIAMNLAAETVRIEAPIPGKSAVGVELPNLKKEVVHLRDVLESNEARKAASRLAVALGKDNSGKMIVADLASMPHVLIAGQTGSGKSVCINAIIISILFRATPEEVRLIMIDPKMVELNVYNTIPHLLVPVVTDPKKAASALEWAVSEMTRRYKEFAARGAKNIQSYNKKLQPGEKPMPQIVIIVDELADLMMTAPHDVEEAINRLAQLARAAGMHLVIATQRPSVNVITGVIKANIPTRIAFTVASGVDSRTILDSYGAESLLGRGDMLYLPPDRNKPVRIQGAWVSEDEVQSVVNYISSVHDTNFDEDIISHMENAALSDAEKSDKREEEADNSVDDLFPVAVRAVMDAGQASISMLQRKLRVGYARAGRLIDEMAARGLVSQSEGSKSREVLITREQYNELFGEDEYA
ncbi:MAG: DNA translocase FtsK [Clostridia bacterium]|nr:DNA translocase FtsK [Clostridia bacterium]